MVTFLFFKRKHKYFNCHFRITHTLIELGSLFELNYKIQYIYIYIHKSLCLASWISERLTPFTPHTCAIMYVHQKLYFKKLTISFTSTLNLLSFDTGSSLVSGTNKKH